jgi:uncharacterized protein YoxC
MEKDVLPTHKSIIALLDQLSEIQSNLYVKYKEYLEKNKTLQVFGLDSFHYQCRLFDLELKQANDHYAFLNNRMFCDYYKLYQVVRSFVKDTFQIEPKQRSYPGYKDLELYKLYEMSDITLLYEDISDMTRKATLEVSRKEKDLARDIQEKGIRIEHFIHHRTSNHALLKTKIELYEKYLSSYHIYHMAFLLNLFERLQMLFRQTEPPKIDPPKTYPPEPMTKYLPADTKDSSSQTVTEADGFMEVEPLAILSVSEKNVDTKDPIKEESSLEPSEEIKEEVNEVKEEVKEETKEVKEVENEVKEEAKEVVENESKEEVKKESKEEVEELDEDFKEEFKEELEETKEIPKDLFESLNPLATVNPVHKKKKKKSKK